MEQEHETRRGVTAVALCSDEGASCLIPHIIAELREPCPCCRPGLTLTGQTRDGRPVTIALERGYIDIRRCEDWTKKILDVKNLTASWKKKDATRFSPKG